MNPLLTSVATILSDPQTIWIALIVSLALFTRASIGFGDGVIAVPLLSFAMELNEAVPFILSIATIMSFIALWKDRAHVQLGSLKRTAGMALLGFPLGIILLGVSNNEIVKSVLGLVLIFLSIWYFSPTKTIHLKSSRWSYLFGLLAGVLGGAYSFRGIVFAIYGSLRGWSPAQFKGTIHSFYLISGLFVPIGYYFAGLLTYRVLGLIVVMFPVALISTLMGTWSSGKLNTEVFQNVIWAFMFLLGVFFVAQNCSLIT